MQCCDRRPDEGAVAEKAGLNGTGNPGCACSGSSGASGSLFGSTGSANFLSRATAVLAAVFFVTSLGLTYLSSDKSRDRGVMATHKAQPAAPAPAEKPAAVPAAPDGSKAQEVPK